MTAQNFIFLNQKNPFETSVTETRQPLHKDSLTYYSWQGKTNIEINSLILLAVPLLLIIAFMIERRKKYLPAKKTKSLKASKLTCSCYQCQYFNQNPYIKCAVNPLLESTNQAYNCKDFKSN